MPDPDHMYDPAPWPDLSDGSEEETDTESGGSETESDGSETEGGEEESS